MLTERFGWEGVIAAVAVLVGSGLVILFGTSIDPENVAVACVCVPLAALVSYFYPPLVIVGLLNVGLFKPHPAVEISLADPTLVLTAVLMAVICLDLTKAFLSGHIQVLRDRLAGQGLGVFLFLMFFASVAVSFIYSPSPVGGWIKLSRFAVFETLAFFAPLVLFKSAKDLRLFIWAAILVSIPLSIRVIAGMLHPSTKQLIREADLTMIGEGNIIGTALLILLFYYFPGIWGRVFSFVVMPLLVVGLVACQARGPMFAFIIVALLCVSTMPLQTAISRKAIITGLVLIAIVFSLAFLWLSSTPGYAVRGNQKIAEVHALLRGTIDAGGTTSIRMNYFRSSLYAFSEKPLQGWGLNGWTIYHFGEDRVYYPHNFILEVAAEQGLPGVALLVSLLLAAFARLLRAARAGYRESLVALPTLMFSVVYNCVTGTVENRILFFWLGTAFAVARMVRQRQTLPVSDGKFRWALSRKTTTSIAEGFATGG